MCPQHLGCFPYLSNDGLLMWALGKWPGGKYAELVFLVAFRVLLLYLHCPYFNFASTSPNPSTHTSVAFRRALWGRLCRERHGARAHGQLRDLGGARCVPRAPRGSMHCLASLFVQGGGSWVQLCSFVVWCEDLLSSHTASPCSSFCRFPWAH